MSDEKFCCEKCGRDIPIDGVGGVGAVAEGLCNECWLDGLEFDWEAEHPDWVFAEHLDDLDFADPGGRSALRAETPTNPRIHPCPECEQPYRLTQKDVDLHYVCDRCADRREQGW